MTYITPKHTHSQKTKTKNKNKTKKLHHCQTFIEQKQKQKKTTSIPLLPFPKLVSFLLDKVEAALDRAANVHRSCIDI